MRLSLVIFLLLCATPAWAQTGATPFGGFVGQGTVKVAANATPTSVNAAISMGQANNLRLCNTGTVSAFVALVATGTATAHTDTDLPVIAGTCVVVSAPGTVNAAAISITTTATNIYVTPGNGGQ